MLPIMRIVFLYISLSISLHATVSKAEPSTHIKTLMDQPLSMLDWGLYSVAPALAFRLWFDSLPAFPKNYFPHWSCCNRLLPSEFFGCNRHPNFSLLRII